MKFLIIYDEWKAEAGALALEIEGWCRDRGAAVEVQPRQIPRSWGFSTVALLLGGDGFITKNSLSLARKRTPFLGINFGTVGFLAVAEPSEWRKALTKVLEGRYAVEKRKILEGYIRRSNEKRERFEAVNDAVLLRGSQKFVRMQVRVDGHTVFENIGGDGVIVSSAVGSTAYNLAAGGPISEKGIILTPLAVHRLDITPLVLAEHRTIEIICLGGSKGLPGEFVLEVDGDNSRRVLPGDAITVRYGKLATRFLVPEGTIFIRSLQQKLGLSK